MSHVDRKIERCTLARKRKKRVSQDDSLQGLRTFVSRIGRSGGKREAEGMNHLLPALDVLDRQRSLLHMETERLLVILLRSVLIEARLGVLPDENDRIVKLFNEQWRQMSDEDLSKIQFNIRAARALAHSSADDRRVSLALQMLDSLRMLNELRIESSVYIDAVSDMAMQLLVDHS